MIAIGFYNYQKICPKVLPNIFTTTLTYSWLLYFAVYSTNPVTRPIRDTQETKKMIAATQQKKWWNFWSR
ncbi:DUF3967 domain-containing protein [Bacillus sp. OTU530]|uniref:DUF3967 domain-containing protein n=1 Tax=Bacillus sp. OTU530 TaxID=3043862 RepID=UPI00313CE71E